jgi:hypothetical protein
LPDGEACLVPVRIAAQSAVAGPSGDDASGSAIEVVLRNGRLLRVTERAGLRHVAQLADALEGYLR